MIIVKYIFLLFIFGASSFIGMLISKKYKNRVIELKEFKDAGNMLESKIRFTYEPLGEIFEQISKIMGNDSKTAKIFKNTSLNMQNNDFEVSWEMAIDDAKQAISLNNEDIEIIKGLGKMLRKNRCTRSIK